LKLSLGEKVPTIDYPLLMKIETLDTMDGKELLEKGRCLISN
jgi:hypothetical protein